MPLVIFAGGSGQHVALMTSRLILLGALSPAIRARVIDADDEATGVAGALRSLGGYVDINHPHPLRAGVDAYLKPFDTAALAEAEGENSFKNLFRISTDHPQDGEIFDALFSPKEAALDISHGFFAMPSLGASAFAAHGAAVIDELSAAVAHADKVFIVGSFIGGTGAGVIPSAIARLTGRGGASWFGVFLLNWLDPPADAPITLDEMASNMRHGLEYFYSEVRPRLSASVLLGPPPTPPAQVFRPARPSTEHPETRSVYPLIAARAVYDLETNSVANFDGSVHVWAHDDAQPQRLLDIPWHGGLTLRQRLHDVERLDRWLGIYDPPEAVERLKKAFGLFGSQSAVPVGLQGISTFAKAAKLKKPEFIDRLLAELSHRRRGLNEARKALRDVYGQLDGDPVTAHFAGDELNGLKRALSKDTEPVDPKAGPERLVSELADQVVSAVLDYRAVT